jgi:hypothetical protein
MTVNEAIREHLLDCKARNLRHETLRWDTEESSAFRSSLAENGIAEID